MEIDEAKIISEKTRVRTTEPIKKDGYKNGAADGQECSYQNSFDLGYELGFQFGAHIGFRDSYTGQSDNNTKKIGKELNCQICLNNVDLQQDITNHIQTQNESNKQYLKY